MRRDWQTTLLHKGLAKGYAKLARNETTVSFDGVAHQIATFEGARWFATGKLTFTYECTKILAVDFDQDLVTDFGWHGYGLTTTRYINGWMCDLWSMKFINTPCVDGQFDPIKWTWSDRYNKTNRFRGEGWHEDMATRFRAKVPWVKWIDGMPWFHGRGWDDHLNYSYENLRGDLLKDSLWRWWTGDWTESGRWIRRFIDADAERRWLALQKRKQRAAARAQAAYTKVAS